MRVTGGRAFLLERLQSKLAPCPRGLECRGSFAPGKTAQTRELTAKERLDLHFRRVVSLHGL